MNGKKRLRRLTKRILSFVLTLVMVLSFPSELKIVMAKSCSEGHKYYCEICGVDYIHNYSQGTCIECGKHCPECENGENLSDGDTCDTCGLEKSDGCSEDHDNYCPDWTCDECGEVGTGDHSYSDGSCSYCNEACPDCENGENLSDGDTCDTCGLEKSDGCSEDHDNYCPDWTCDECGGQGTGDHSYSDGSCSYCNEACPECNNGEDLSDGQECDTCGLEKSGECSKYHDNYCQNWICDECGEAGTGDHDYDDGSCCDCDEACPECNNGEDLSDGETCATCGLEKSGGCSADHDWYCPSWVCGECGENGTGVHYYSDGSCSDCDEVCPECNNGENLSDGQECDTCGLEKSGGCTYDHSEHCSGWLCPIDGECGDQDHFWNNTTTCSDCEATHTHTYKCRNCGSGIQNHLHKWSYVADDSILKAYCTEAEGEEYCSYQGTEDDLTEAVSLTLTATSPDYSDSTTGWCLAEDVAIELEGASDWGVVGDLPTIHYVGTTADGSEYSSDNKPTQDGSYTTYIVCDEAKAELNFEIGHVFGEVVKDEYLALPADYTSPAKYYNSCEICGEKGKETFTDGKKLQLTTPKLSNTSVTVDSVVVKWSSVEDAELYRVFRKNDAGTWVKVNDTTTNSFEDKNVESGKSYTYTVRCVSADGKTYMSAYNKTGVTATYCSMPELKSAKPLVSGVQIVWDDVAGAVCYRVYRKVSGGSWENVGETDAALFVDKTAVSGNKYIYTVKCIDSSKTKAVSAYNNKGISVTFYSAPSLKSIGVYNDGVRLTWREVTGAPKYRVYRRTNDGAWEALGAVETTSYVDTTAEIGKKYTYTVRCVNEKNTVKYSSYNGTGRTVIVCEKPKITAISSTTEGVNVEWGAVADASSYRLYRKVAGGEWIKIANTTSTSYVDTTAVKGTRYKYVVRCLDSNERTLFSGYDTAGKTITFK